MRQCSNSTETSQGVGSPGAGSFSCTDPEEFTPIPPGGNGADRGEPAPPLGTGRISEQPYSQTEVEGWRNEQAARAESWEQAHEQGVMVTEKPGGLIVEKNGRARNSSGGGKRGRIDSFSSASRRRQIRQLLGVPFGDYVTSPQSEVCRGVFISLTYHRQWWSDKENLKRHQHNFEVALMRRFPVEGGMWRLEVQEERLRRTGVPVPHYHFLALFSEPVDRQALESWVSEYWHNMAGFGSPEHAEHGADVQFLTESGPKLLRYLTKYLGKESPCEGLLWGRRWGVFGNLPQLPGRKVFLDEAQAQQFARRVRRFGKNSPFLSRWRADHSGTIFGASLDLVRGLSVVIPTGQPPPF